MTMMPMGDPAGRDFEDNHFDILPDVNEGGQVEEPDKKAERQRARAGRQRKNADAADDKIPRNKTTKPAAKDAAAAAAAAARAPSESALTQQGGPSKKISGGKKHCMLRQRSRGMELFPSGSACCYKDRCAVQPLNNADKRKNPEKHAWWSSTKKEEVQFHQAVLHHHKVNGDEEEKLKKTCKRTDTLSCMEAIETHIEQEQLLNDEVGETRFAIKLCISKTVETCTLGT